VNGALARKIAAMAFLVMIAAAAYEFIAVDARNWGYAIGARTPKLVVMLIAAFCIGSASVVFQTIIRNTVVTPCLLGMNSLYILVHTAVVFALGSANILVSSKTAFFAADMSIMGAAAVFIYGTLLRKTGGNILYVLLAGTVMATLFGSVTSALQRVMDPNEFLTLQNALIASFHKVNSEIISFSLAAIAGVIFFLRGDLALLDVIALGREGAVNLGVDYDRTVPRLLIGVALFIAIATAMVGPISFLGLIIANLSRQMFKTYRHSYLIFGSALAGMITLIAGQTLIERVFSFNANIGAFINVLGGVYFLFLLLKNRSA
jgi:iron complex transport system permease protein